MGVAGGVCGEGRRGFGGGGRVRVEVRRHVVNVQPQAARSFLQVRTQLASVDDCVLKCPLALQAQHNNTNAESCHCQQRKDASSTQTQHEHSTQ